MNNLDIPHIMAVIHAFEYITKHYVDLDTYKLDFSQFDSDSYITMMTTKAVHKKFEVEIDLLRRSLYKLDVTLSIDDVIYV